MTMPVARNQRFTRNNPCPVCGGHAKLPHGQGVRCFGYLSEDGNYCHCTREEYAGGITKTPNSETYAHFMHGVCRCGTQHGPEIPPVIIDLQAARLNADGVRDYTRTTYGYRQPEVEYSYTDEHGEILFQTLRYADPKDFSQRHPNERGEWVYNLQGVRRVLYRLPELIRAKPDQFIFVVEGEKDVETLRGLSITATTNPLGAKKWREEYNSYFKNRHVVIIPDNDKDGREHAHIVTEQLKPYVASLRVLELPGVKEKGDVSDWLKDGHDPQELVELVQQAEEIELPKPDIFPLLTFEDLGNLPQPEWLIGHEIVKGYLTGIYGKSHLGKSFKALDYALTAAQEYSVVYIIAENANGYYARVKAWCDHNQKPPGNIRFITIPVQILDLMQVEKLKRTLGIVNPALVVIDTLSKTFMGGDENSTNDMRSYVASCNELRTAFNTTVIVVHHEPKAGNSPRGSNVFFSDMDTIIRLEKTDTDKVVKVSCEKQKDAAPFEAYNVKITSINSGDDIFSFEASCVLVPLDCNDVTGDVITNEFSEKDLEIIRLLKSVGGLGKGITSMMEELGIEHRNNESARVAFMKRVRRLREHRLIVQHKERGPYFVTEKGIDLLPAGEVDSEF